MGLLSLLHSMNKTKRHTTNRLNKVEGGARASALAESFGISGRKAAHLLREYDRDLQSFLRTKPSDAILAEWLAERAIRDAQKVSIKKSRAK
ncbi:MAG: hypothetical protein M1298_01135 [Chloroflexi bacterium]|nr:hypothetical protein [Chloroflexota bacterium]